MVGFSISYDSNERVIALVKRALVNIANCCFGNKYQSVIPILDLAAFFKNFTCNLTGEGELLTGDLPMVRLAKISLLMTAPALSHSRLVSIKLVLYYDSSDMLSGRMVWSRKPSEGSHRRTIIEHVDNIFIAESLRDFFSDEIVSSETYYSAIKHQLSSLHESESIIQSHSVPTLPPISMKSSSYPRIR